MSEIQRVPEGTGGVWVDGAGRAWPLSHHMVIRIARTKEWVCEFCQIPVTLFDIVTEVACLPRIGGDSANGYEAFHKECLTESCGTPVATATDARAVSERVNDWCREHNSIEWSYNSRATYTGSALRAGIITRDEYEIVKAFHGNLWNYVGD